MNRKKINEKFSGEELTLLLFSIVRAHQQLIYSGVILQDLQTGSIVYDKDTKVFKIYTINQIYPYDIDRAKSFQMKKIFNKE